MAKTNQELFGDLSAVLTGLAGLDPQLFASFYDRLVAVFPIEMPKLLAAFGALAVKDEADVTNNIIKNSATPKEVIALVKEIVNIWYLGNFFMPGADHTMMPPTTVAQYQGQQMYALIKAPLRAYSNLSATKHGDWALKPTGE